LKKAQTMLLKHFSGSNSMPASQPSALPDQAPKPMPVAFFGMAVGTLAWGHSWQAAAQVWPLPTVLVHLAMALGLGLWALLLLAYARTWWRMPSAARAELKLPVPSAMAALVTVSTLLAAISLKTLAPAVAWVLLGLGLVAQLGMSLWLSGRFWQGGRAPESINASVYLPTVAQNFVAATALASFGWTTLASLFFGAGLFSWLALESMVMGRAATLSALDAAQRPLQGIQLAPAVVGGLSYMALTSGPPDLMAHMLLGYGLYQALLAARLLPWTLQSGFAPSYWAFSFGIMALTTMALRMQVRAPEEALWPLLTPVLFGVANLVMATLLWRTLGLARQGRLWPPAVPAPPTPAMAPPAATSAER
jgi:tellurite resistance protein